MKFETLADILSHKFVGNHMADKAAFDAVDEFCIRNDISLRDKIKASIYLVEKGVGAETPSIEEVFDLLHCTYMICKVEYPYQEEEEQYYQSKIRKETEE